MFKGWGLIKLLLVGCVGLIPVLIIYSLLNTEKLNTVNEHKNTLKQINVIKIANAISSYAKRAEGHLLLYLIIQDETDREKFFKRHSSIANLTKEIAPLLTNDIQFEHVELIKTNTKKLYALSSKVFEIFDRENTDIKPSELREFYEASSSIRKIGVLIVEETTELLKVRNDQFIKNQQNVHLLMFVSITFSLILLGVIYVFHQRSHEARAMSRAKSEFLATMSHELRTPLNAIIGFSDMLRGQYFGALGSGKYKEYADDIFDSGTHLLNLVNDILDLSTIEAGEHALDKELVLIKNEVINCFPMIDELARQKGINYVVEVPDDLPKIRADSRAIKQILINLLNNAVKFTPEGGKITLSITDGNPHQTIEVIDTGKGIPSNIINSLTKPFVKEETNPYKAQEGTGLGLSIVKLLVELHKGKLYITSEVGKGTIVTVKLPSEVT